MTKTIIKTICAIIMILGIMFILAYSETHYTRTGHIIKVEDNVYSFSDGTGNNWEFYSDTIIPINAIVNAKFYTNNTIDNIKDDMLIDYEIISYDYEVNITI